MHNSRDWIGETLRSILGQTVPSASFELVLVDDASTDDGVDVATAALAGASIEWRLLQSSKRGPSHARNLGTRAARGTWIQFLDSDDLIHPEKLSIQLRALQQEASGVALVYSDWTTLTQSSSGWDLVAPSKKPRVSENTVEQLLRAENFVPFAACLLN